MNISITQSGITAIINSKGAELISLKQNNGNELIWEGDPKFWGKHAPVLFPIVGTLKDNQYSYDNNIYHLSRHGFARDSEFDLKNKSENSATFSLKQSYETLKIYPFEFELQIKYTIIKSELKIEYLVSNNSDKILPFSLGAHPAFSLNGVFTDYSLDFEGADGLMYNLLQQDLISEKTAILPLRNGILSLNYSLFENDALIFKNIKSKKITVRKNNVPILNVAFSDFPDLGIWTKQGAPFLCIEPWFGYSDSPESDGNILHKSGIQLLQSKSDFKAQFVISIL